jgi:hypothetical protein
MAGDHVGPLDAIPKTKTFGLRRLLRLGLEDRGKFVAEIGKLLPQEVELEHKADWSEVWRALEKASSSRD